MESTGRNDRNSSEEFPPNVGYEWSAVQLSHTRNSNQSNDIGIQQLSSSRASSLGGSSRRRHSISSRVAPDITDDDIESEVVSEVGDIGDREIHSRRYSGVGSPHFSTENYMSGEDGAVPITGGLLMQRIGTNALSSSHGTNALSSISSVSPFPSEPVSSISTEPNLYMRDKNQSRSAYTLDKDQSRSAYTSAPHVKEFKKELPLTLEYVLSLVHLAVFGILGVLTRYLLQKLFGPQVAGVTSDRSLLYLDLPSNVVGSFLMGWLGVIFKGDISHVSNFLAIGLTTGYLGSLTTFSGWNQKMLDLSVQGLWVDAALGIILGLLIAAESIRLGIETAKGFRWLLNRFSTSSRSDASSSRNSCRIDGLSRHIAVLFVLLLILALLWGFSGVLLRRWFDGGNTNGQLWLACIVGPPGVWARWFLARLNGQGLGRAGLLKWIPFGTLIANVLAACVMASLATVKKVVNTEKCDTIATGIQFGLLGCLSTVSTFIAEFHAMRESDHPWRAFVYASITLLPSFILGTLIYSIPVWTKGYQR